MKFFKTTAFLPLAISFVCADYLPELVNNAPSIANVKERISPPNNMTVFDVWFARGNRIYQCNPELTGFQHWYNVQTQAYLYPTQRQEAPFDVQGREIGQLNAAPLDPLQQMANPLDTMPVIYSYREGSWVSTGRPLATTTLEEGRVERGDNIHLDDHLTPVIRTSTNGYLSHTRYIVRIGSLDGVVPAAGDCVRKGSLVNKPFTAYYMFYTDDEGLNALEQEHIEWERLVEEYTPENLNSNVTEEEDTETLSMNSFAF
ncbi:uncharacterized protein BX663DRAFT_485248 [Cokeromyces recurvatus]|uniref:uncharacterized protein n=1 Tax=Cokeromyces recurvatus TaxID=90255 RepID=UPI00221F4809|nr:uncharacterized protein BX663DRAFT_485248 [Cokeromyces recurvatus]KAI7904433.1 hypothetical protein BX663DRAFT_485248 [Cokeromyces recurvatus]